MCACVRACVRACVCVCVCVSLGAESTRPSYGVSSPLFFGPTQCFMTAQSETEAVLEIAFFFKGIFDRRCWKYLSF